jgi:hypothetical protein
VFRATHLTCAQEARNPGQRRRHTKSGFVRELWAFKVCLHLGCISDPALRPTRPCSTMLLDLGASIDAKVAAALRAQTVGQTTAHKTHQAHIAIRACSTADLRSIDRRMRPLVHSFRPPGVEGNTIGKLGLCRFGPFARVWLRLSIVFIHEPLAFGNLLANQIGILSAGPTPPPSPLIMNACVDRSR